MMLSEKGNIEKNIKKMEDEQKRASNIINKTDHSSEDDVYNYNYQLHYAQSNINHYKNEITASTLSIKVYTWLINHATAETDPIDI